MSVFCLLPQTKVFSLCYVCSLLLCSSGWWGSVSGGDRSLEGGGGVPAALVQRHQQHCYTHLCVSANLGFVDHTVAHEPSFSGPFFKIFFLLFVSLFLFFQRTTTVCLLTPASRTSVRTTTGMLPREAWTWPGSWMTWR